MRTLWSYGVVGCLALSLCIASAVSAEETATITANTSINVIAPQNVAVDGALATENDPATQALINNGGRVPFTAGGTPPYSAPGEAWCLKYIPGETNSVCQEIEVSPATFYYETIPAQYEWREIFMEVEPSYTKKNAGECYYDEELIEVVVRDAYTTYEIIPPVWRCVDQCVEIIPPSQREDWNCVTFKTVEERIMVKPARREQRKITNPDGTVCYTMVELPPEYISICRKVCDENAAANKVPVPGKTINIPKMELVTPAQVVEKKVPEEVKTVVRKIPRQNPCVDVPVEAKTIAIKQMIKVADECQRRVEVPAKKATIISSNAEKGSLWWVRVNCGVNTTTTTVRDLATKYGSMPCTVVMN